MMKKANSSNSVENEEFWFWLLINKECNRVVLINEKESSNFLDLMCFEATTSDVAIETGLASGGDFIPKQSASRDNFINEGRFVHFEGKLWKISRLQDDEIVDRNTSTSSRLYGLKLLQNDINDGEKFTALADRVVRVSILNRSWDMTNLPPIPEFKKQVSII
jgi:hypothetical protein